MEPLSILEVADRDGNVLEENHPEPHEAIRADTAYMITNLLEGVTREGTAKHAASLNWPIGGKTGTTDQATDTWFIGFDPDITIGVWVGYDLKKSLGSSMQGAVVALPIWEDIMKTWIERRKKELSEPPTFVRPGNIVTVDTEKGPEVYIAGTEPTHTAAPATAE
jgi:penicillin-binding protein 1A